MSVLKTFWEEMGHYGELKLHTFMEGMLIPVEEVPDPVFSRNILGEGIAVIPEGTVLMSPIDGIVCHVMRSAHSCCIEGEKGIELLLHIGVNTVEMNGRGFRVLVREGQEVKAGEPLIHFSLQAIAEAGYSPISVMIITETGQYDKVKFGPFGPVKKGDIIAQIR